MYHTSKLIRLIKKIFGSVMVLVYAGVGCVFLLGDDFFSGITGPLKYSVGVMLLAYAGFRGYRVFKSIKDEQDEV